jgi:hypothetical protein
MLLCVIMTPLKMVISLLKTIVFLAKKLFIFN